MEAGKEEHGHEVRSQLVRHERLLPRYLLDDVVQEITMVSSCHAITSISSRYLHGSLPLLQRFLQHLHCTPLPLQVTYRKNAKNKGYKLVQATKIDAVCTFTHE